MQQQTGLVRVAHAEQLITPDLPRHEDRGGAPPAFLSEKPVVDTAFPRKMGIAARFHDSGKIVVAPTVSSKGGALTSEEPERRAMSPVDDTGRFIDLDQFVAWLKGLDSGRHHEEATARSGGRRRGLGQGRAVVASPEGSIVTDPCDTAATLLHCLNGAQACTAPFRHWRLESALPAATIAAIAALPFAPPAAAAPGKREINNSTRVFFSAESRARFAVCQQIAQAMQGGTIVDRLESLCGTRLGGSFLRIEYCQDTDGFWLEPHTDIGAKLFTMLVYLSTGHGADDWGTDLMNQRGDVLATVPYRPNAGLIFVPGDDTWHGFRKRPIEGIRRSLIVNYVKPEWRARHELAFPDRPVA